MKITKKEGFEAQGFNPRNGVASRQKFLTTIATIGEQESFRLGCFFRGDGGSLGFCFLGGLGVFF
jgi:hypothetical protein